MHGRRMSTDKPNDFANSIKKVFTFNKKLMPLIIIALVLSSTSSILSIIGPDKLKEITNLITEGIRTNIDLDAVRNVGIILIVFYTLSFLFGYLQGYIMAVVTNRFSKSMRNEIASKINRLPLSYFDKTTVGDVLSRVTNDVDTICMTLNQSLGTLVSAITLFFGSLIMMFYTNVILAITAVLSTLIGFSLMGVIMKRSQKYFIAVQKD